MIRFLRVFHRTTVNAAIGCRCMSTGGPSSTYESLVSNGSIIADKVQLKAVTELQQLYDKILEYKAVEYVIEEPAKAEVTSSSSGGWFSSSFGRNNSTNSEKKDSNVQVKSRKTLIFPSPAPSSLYLYGGTGCGKTYLMDLFYDTLPIKGKRRIHFHNFMIDIHKRLHAYRMRNNAAGGEKKIKGTVNNNLDTNDAINTIVHEMLVDTGYVLCFDEFQVTDIADAMILKSLFTKMFEAGYVIVATSNRHPDELYKNGLQRDLFLPFIHLLKSKAIIHSLLDSSVDYRLIKNKNRADNLYISPSSANNTDYIKQYNDNYNSVLHDVIYGLPKALTDPGAAGGAMAVVNTTKTVDITVYGHKVKVPKVICGRKIAIFTFEELCSTALGAADYIDIGKLFHTIFLRDIPFLNINNRNELRRFIVLIDSLYEANVVVSILAPASPIELLQVSADDKKNAVYDEVFAYDRTVSRLLEMSSLPYLEACHAKRPHELVTLASILEVDIDSKVAVNRSIHVSIKQLRDIWDLYTIPHSTQDNKNIMDTPTLYILLLDMFELLLKKREIPTTFISHMNEIHNIPVQTNIMNIDYNKYEKVINSVITTKVS